MSTIFIDKGLGTFYMTESYSSSSLTSPQNDMDSGNTFLFDSNRNLFENLNDFNSKYVFFGFIL